MRILLFVSKRVLPSMMLMAEHLQKSKRQAHGGRECKSMVNLLYPLSYESAAPLETELQGGQA